MADRAKKVTELAALTSASGDDLLLIVDSPGSAPESKKITVANFVGNVASNALFRGTLSVNGAVTFSSNVTANGTIVFTTTAPLNSTSNGVSGQVAFDSNFIYYCVSANTWKRASLSSW